MKVEYEGEDKEATAIYITGQGINYPILKLKQHVMELGWKRQVTLRFRMGLFMGQWKGNGVDLWKSNHNTIQNMNIGNVADGIYLEQSHKNTLSQNHIQFRVMVCI